MKQRSQETTPLWVWFSLGLLVIAIIAYAVGYLMFEQINPDRNSRTIDSVCRGADRACDASYEVSRGCSAT